MDLLALQHMDSHSVMTLLPIQGQRIRFNIFREKWVKTLENSVEELNIAKPALSEPCASISTCEEPNELSALPSVSGNQLKTIAVLDLNGNLTQFPETIMEEDSENESFEVANEFPSTSSSQPKAPPAVTKITTSSQNVKGSYVRSFEVANELPSTSFSQPKAPPAVTKITTSCQNVKGSYNLEDILNSTTGGKLILKKFNESGKFLKDSTRDDLVELVLDHETGEDLRKQISRERLLFLAENIVRHFKTERQSVYFESFVHPKSGKTITKGKLVWRYYNRRREFAKCGVISKVKPAVAKGAQSPSQVISKHVVIDKEMSGCLLWLANNRGNKGNWDQVLRNWKKTSVARLSSLIHSAEIAPEEEEDSSDRDPDGKTAAKSQGKRSSKKQKLTPREIKAISDRMANKTAHDYMVKYPAFQENTGHMLFEIDFQTLQPDIDPLELFTEWPTLQSFVVEQLQKTIPEFLNDSTVTPGERTLQILTNIRKLFPIVSISGAKKGKRVWRPSHAEASDAFVLLVNSALALEESKDDRRSELMKHRLHMQPFVAVIGDFQNPLQFCVCVDDFFWDVESVLEAVDLVFKSFHALHTPYPPEAEQIWLFLQRAIYGFSTDEDAHFAGVNAMVAEYESFKNRLLSASN